MHTNYQPQYRDGLGDGGEQFYEIVASLARRGWTDAEIREEVAAVPRRFAPPPGWDTNRMREEIEIGIARVRPLEPKQKVVKLAPPGDGLPVWLRLRIESTEIPLDRAGYFRETVGALAAHGWDAQRIEVAIYDKLWLPDHYRGSGLKSFAIPVAIAQAQALAKAKGRSLDAAPDDVAAASDLRAVQRAIAARRRRWRENSQARDWVGHAVAAALKLDVERDKPEISGLLKAWIANGSLVVVEAEDQQRKRRNFIEVGTSAK